MTINLLIIILFNLFLYFLFYKLISQKWIPNKNTIIALIIGSLLVQLVLPIQKFIQNIIFSNELQTLTWASIEEIFKLISIVLLLYFCKSRKFTFLEILGVGIGFSFLETILFVYKAINYGSYIYPGLPATFYVAFLTLILRALGALVMHVLTVGMMALTLIYLKNKKRFFIILVFPLSIYIHFWFNKNMIMNNGQDFLFIISIIWLLFAFVFSSFLYIESRMKNSESMKIAIIKIGKFLLKYVTFLILSLGLIYIFISFNLLGLQRYSIQEIEQTKVMQEKLQQNAKIWDDGESTKEIERIKEIYKELNNNYTRIIGLMEVNNEELSESDIEFLTSRQIPLRVELVDLQNKLFVRDYEERIAKITQIQKDLTNSFKGKNLTKNLKDDYLAYMEISKQIIDTDKLIITKKKLGENLSEEEINYIDYESNEKMSELNKIMGRLNNY